jgi:hypothetical protein
MASLGSPDTSVDRSKASSQARFRRPLSASAAPAPVIISTSRAASRKSFWLYSFYTPHARLEFEQLGERHSLNRGPLAGYAALSEHVVAFA